MKLISILLICSIISGCTLLENNSSKNCIQFQVFTGKFEDTANISWLITYYLDRLNLQSISNGADSIEVRLWFPSIIYIDSSRHLVRFKMGRNNIWKLYRTDIRYDWYGGLDDIDGKCSTKQREFSPDSTIVNALLACTPIVSDSHVHDYKCLDLVGRARTPVILEYATPCSYWVTELWSPNQINDSCKSASDTLFFKLLQGLQKQDGLEFIKNYIE